jgi:glutamyl-tRNA synthetase
MTPPPATGRFAPSPTGDLHLGGARTALVAWLAARSGGGRFVLRMEDLDGPRVVPGAAGRILEDLRALGLDWDEGPDVGGARGPYRQSERTALYASAVERLAAAGRLFPCSCSRADLGRAARAAPSAPHGPADDGPRYPGTCRARSDGEARAPRGSDGRRPALRFRVDEGEVEFADGVRGAVRSEPAHEVGDFVVRRADGLHAYQLAVVVDDAAMGVTDVVRGDDLLSSTGRQLLLYRALGLPPPRFAHLPLVLGPDLQRLSKRHGAISVRACMSNGISATRIVCLLAESLGLIEPGTARELRPSELLPGFALARLPRAPTMLDPAAL